MREEVGKITVTEINGGFVQHKLGRNQIVHL